MTEAVLDLARSLEVDLTLEAWGGEADAVLARRPPGADRRRHRPARGRRRPGPRRLRRHRRPGRRRRRGHRLDLTRPRATVPGHDAVVRLRRPVGDGGRAGAGAGGGGLRGPAADLRRPRRAGQPAGRPPAPRGRRARRPRRRLPDQRDRVPGDDAGGLQAAGRPGQRELPLRRGRAALPVRRRRGRGRWSTTPSSPTAWPAIRDDLPELAVELAVGEAYEAALAAADPAPAFDERSSDDLYILYTGGTTGMPKGVVWRQEDAFHSCIGGGRPRPAARRHHHARGDRRAHRPRGLGGRLPAGRPAHARRRAVDEPVLAVRRRQGRPPARLARAPRRLADRSPTRGCT